MSIQSHVYIYTPQQKCPLHMLTHLNIKAGAMPRDGYKQSNYTKK